MWYIFMIYSAGNPVSNTRSVASVILINYSGAVQWSHVRAGHRLVSPGGKVEPAHAMCVISREESN